MSETRERYEVTKLHLPQERFPQSRLFKQLSSGIHKIHGYLSDISEALQCRCMTTELVGDFGPICALMVLTQ